MKEEYRREMEQLGPRPEELKRLYAVIEGGTEMKKAKRLGGKAAAVLVCAALMVTAAAAATAPAVWEALQARLGAFAPYAQTIEGAACADQGVEVRVLSAISDDLEARVYLSVQDVEEDRLNEFLTLDGKLVAGEEKALEGDSVSGLRMIEPFSTSRFELVSYDAKTKTALLSARVSYDELTQPNGAARLDITGMTTRKGSMRGSVSCASVTGAELKSLPAGENDKVIFKLYHVRRFGNDPKYVYDNGTDYFLPDEQVVLAPGQTPMGIEGTEDMRVSSMGFASDGCFHIRLEFADGVAPETFEITDFDMETGTNLTAGQISSMLSCDLIGNEDDVDMKFVVVRETLVEGGMDVLFPLLKAEDLKEIQSRQARVYGTYTRPGTAIEGSWSTEFELDYYPSTVLGWTGELAGWQVKRVTVSPLSVTMNSNASGGLRIPLYAVKKDGSAVAAQPSTSGYHNVGAMSGGEDRWEAYTTWKFEEPVEVEDVVSLKLGDAVIPVN